MKKITIFLLFLVLGTAAFAQSNVVFSLGNAQITNDGTNDFYEVDIFVTSDTDITMGDATMALNYNSNAFGTSVFMNGNVEFGTDDTSSILGSVTEPFPGFTIPNYNAAGFITADNLPNRVALSWQQANSQGTIGINVPANNAVLLVHVKLTYLDVTESPDFCFELSTPFDGAYFEACGPFTPTPFFEAANCLASPGAQITSVTGDCSGGILGTDYVWQNGAWTPSDPSGVATASDNITILDTGAALTANTTANNLTIGDLSGLNLGSTQLSLSGNLTISDLGSVLFSGNATIEFAGSGSQIISGATSVDNLIMNNSGSTDSVLNGDFIILNSLVLTDGTLAIGTGTLTLRSDVQNTAMVDQVVDGSINGDVTVEQFIPSRRAFRFVASSVNSSSSINANWQEGATMASSNPNPGFGTHITGSTTGANGFDGTPSGAASLFGWDNVGQSFNTPMNTDATNLTVGEPYRLFVRGDRSIDVNSSTSPSNNTILRNTGTIQTGAITQSFVTDSNESPAEFMLTGNPYAASVDLNSIVNAGGTQNLNNNFYFVWDASQGTRGAYVTVDLASGTNTSGSTANQFLQPGQSAFMLLSSTVSGTTTRIIYSEADKNIGQLTDIFGEESFPFLPPPSINIGQNNLIVQLKDNDNSLLNPIVDSFKIDFDATNSNNVDANDAPKFLNIDENMSIVNGSNLLSIERRSIPLHDEQIALRMSNYRTSNYILSIDASNYNTVGVTPYLQDNFLNTLTELTNSINEINITVNSSNASGAQDRFTIVFKNQTLSSADTENINSFELFPNPVKDTAVTLTAAQFSGEEVGLSVTNALGQQVYSKKVSFTGASIQLDMFRELPTGVYIVSIDANDNTITQKIVKK